MFERLRNAAGIERFILAGGTGLALRIEHRLSEDLDFITAGKLDRRAIHSVLEHLSRQGRRLTRIVQPLAALEFDLEGADADDYGQDWRVDGVKLTFLAKRVEPSAAQSHLRRVLRSAAVPKVDCGNIRVATEACIFSLKSQLLQERLLTRDLFDLRALIETGRYSIAQVFEEATRLGSNAELIKEKVILGRLRKDDPGVNTLHGEKVDPQGVIGWFREQINEFERGLAEKAATDRL